MRDRHIDWLPSEYVPTRARIGPPTQVRAFAGESNPRPSGVRGSGGRMSKVGVRPFGSQGRAVSSARSLMSCAHLQG